ncbi:MAG TPA: sporulation inhibitor of replication protein SirA [Bacillales bacterium]
MRHYHIFLIEDEIAEAFFGDESKLFHLFLEKESTNTIQRRRILQKQIDYITRPIIPAIMQGYLDEALRYRSDYYTCAGFHRLEAVSGESRSELRLGKGRLTMRSTGGFESETTFFEVLRQVERCFLAMDFRRQRYGWLNPIKQTHFV